MTTTTLQTVRKAPRKLALLLAAVAGLGSLGFAPAKADAGSHIDVRLNVRAPIDSGGDFCTTGQPVDVVRYETRTSQIWVEPEYRTVSDRVWVDAEYRTVCDRVWREAVVQNVDERVWIPARFEERRVEHRDRWGHGFTTIERVCVEPGHFETRCRQVVVQPAGWETVERREAVAEGHWQNVDRQELVTPGHYETRTEQVPVAVRDDRPINGVGYFQVRVGR